MENDKLTNGLSEKCEELTKIDGELEKLQKKYDSLHSDYKWVNRYPSHIFRSLTIALTYRNLLEIKSNAENTLRTAKEWQNEQKQRDDMINKKISMQTDHIR